MQNCSINPFSFSSGIVPVRFQGVESATQAAGWCDILQIASNIVGLLFSLAVPIAILMVVWGGITMITAAGNESRIQSGQGFIKSAVIGVAIVFGAGVIIGTVLKGIGVDTSLIPWL